MSVITSYVMKTEDNIVEKLENAGILSRGKMFEVPKYKFDDKGRGHLDGTRKRYTATVNLAKLWPEDWGICLAEICKQGTSDSADVVFGNIENYATLDYIRHIMAKPTVPADRNFDRFGQQDGKWGYFTRDKSFNAGSIQFTPFDDATMLEITDGAKMLAKMWQPGENGRARRDYTEQEKAKMSIYSVEFDEDGKCISYSRNYAHGIDDIVPNYISHFLPSVRIHLIICTECFCDYDGYSENGEFGDNQAPSRQAQDEALYAIAE